ncbi:MAG: hypothetical protein ACREA0_03755 [bacterium]
MFRSSSRIACVLLAALSTVPSAVARAEPSEQKNPRDAVGPYDEVQPGPGAAGFGFTSNDLDCLEPTVEMPPIFTSTPTESEPSQVVLSAVPGLRVRRNSADLLSFSGARLTGGSRPQALGSICKDVAADSFYEDLWGPQNFPTFHFPEQPCDDLPDCATAREAWMRAHYYTWAARQVIHLIASQDHVEKKKYLWERPGAGSNGQSLGQRTSPAFWFGGWSDERFATVKRAIDKLWGVVTTGKTDVISIQLAARRRRPSRATAASASSRRRTTWSRAGSTSATRSSTTAATPTAAAWLPTSSCTICSSSTATSGWRSRTATITATAWGAVSSRRATWPTARARSATSPPTRTRRV